MERLTKAQKNVLKAIFDERLSEEEALEKERTSVKVFENWLRESRFKKEHNTLMERCGRRANLIITTYKEIAALQLIKLTDCDKEVTARQACLDIINMENTGNKDKESEAPRAMRPETQEAILNIMSEENAIDNK